ncbi:hypothetical protein E2F43_16460 [Seongchinamella unica]|uniref:Co-chaperone DjlA N-terminal domain-containing protein n=1 Tax=Seongchinamella unica TaxID=2547392 RepID=A0A4R5LNQ5_9GAMM|nr:TerB family tellurite resistance protein [Seongchinamella unica]TDG11955.1 hypothetical protein E2F43_16460 [Seongchinamella unica]
MPVNYGLVLKGDQLILAEAPRETFFDPRYLVAALLHHVAQGDGVVCELETWAMIDLVAENLKLDRATAEQKFTQALALYSSNLDLDRVGEVLSGILSDAEREDVLVMLLQVIAADGRQGSDELAALDDVAACLSVTAEERHLAFSRYFDECQQPAGSDRRQIHFRQGSAL